MRAASNAVVIHTSDERDLDDIALAHVQAVVYEPAQLPAWFDELAAAVRSERFVVPRTLLGEVTSAEIAAWLDRHLPVDTLERGTGEALRADILAIVERVARTVGTSRFTFRVFTGTPNRHCGFHVDTVPPGAPRFGVLRVYNGAGTQYAVPGDLTSTRDFYRYLSRRDRLIRELGDASTDADHARILAELVALDDGLEFIQPSARLGIAPAGSLVAFKHLDAQLHWSDHDPGLAWIHCSPMAGEPRFVVNVSATRAASHAARGAIAR